MLALIPDTALAADYESLSKNGGTLSPVITRLSTLCMGTLSLGTRPLVFTIPTLMLLMVIKLPMSLSPTVLSYLSVTSLVCLPVNDPDNVLLLGPQAMVNCIPLISL